MVFVFEFSETARNFKSEFVLHGMIKEINVEDWIVYDRIAQWRYDSKLVLLETTF